MLLLLLWCHRARQWRLARALLRAPLSLYGCAYVCSCCLNQLLLLVQLLLVLLLLLLRYRTRLTDIWAGANAAPRSQTPDMGWNSWNHFGGSVSAAVMREAADQFVALGLREAGYVYINSDDEWSELNRSASGRLVPKASFGGEGGMRNLSAYIHARGLKFGLYGAAAQTTCGGSAGGLYHEQADAQTLREWEVDYFKYDNCGTINIQSYAKYQTFRDALNHTGRHIVYSFEPHQRPHVYAWNKLVGNSWRTGNDIGADYRRIFANLVANNLWAGVTGKGAWGDADMLEVGNPGLSVPEARTHFALWCLVKSPLLIGADLKHIGADYLAILKNRHLIKINQDPGGKQAALVHSEMDADGRRLDLLVDEKIEPPLTDGEWSAHVKKLRLEYEGVTDCEYEGLYQGQQRTTISAAQIWTLSNGTIRGHGDEGEVCLTVGSNAAVHMAACDGGVKQQWSGLELVQNTTAPIMHADKLQEPSCLSTDGGSLFMQECLQDPPHCWLHAPDCPVSVRVGQLWYFTRTGQLVSSFTEKFNMSTRDPTGQPKCLATAANTRPVRPPAPPSQGADPSLPLQVWKGELSGSALAVALVNAGNSSATITATWEVLGLAAGVELDVFDAIRGRANGTASGSVRATVGSHDVEVVTLTPRK